MLYRNSQQALQVLLADPALMVRARNLIKADINAAEAVLKGGVGEIYNTDGIIAFLHDFAEKAPLDLKLLSMTVQNELQTSKQTGELFFGFLLH